MRNIVLLTCIFFGLCGASEARPLRIVMTNDDGLSSNIVALYRSLRAEGYDVIVSVPCKDQSGMGAAVKLRQPLLPLAADCRNGAARKGEPGAGKITGISPSEDWNYVDGTPVMSLLYGLDVVAKERWGGDPDLILSGPNIGNNVGPIILFSGTVNNALYGASRGIPAIALSAHQNTGGDLDPDNLPSKLVAGYVTSFVKQIVAQRSTGKRFPGGVALNVNFPISLANLKWKPSKVGTFDIYKMRFVSLAQGQAKQSDNTNPPFVDAMAADARPKKDEMNDEAVVSRDAISVSAMQAGFVPSETTQRWLKSVVSRIR